jgi:glycosyltransferase involved in cell wall biosynthesis
VSDSAALHILHVNIGGDRLAVDGLPNSMRRRAAAQADLGHFPELVDVREHPELTDRHLVALVVARLKGVDRPDVIHFYSVFRPWHAALGRLARRLRVPYVVAPASGYSDGSMGRLALRKRAFVTLVDGPFARASLAVVCRTETEVGEVRGVTGARTPIFILPNDAPVSSFPDPIWCPADDLRPTLICLARHDVWHKGLDRLAALARSVPEADFIVYGERDRNAPRAVEVLQRNAPSNFVLASPVFAAAKVVALAGAAMYIQLSRFESTSGSVLEAMTAGVPLAVSRYIGVEMSLEESPAALVLSDDTATAATQLRAAFGDQPQLTRWAAAARRLALTVYDPATTAAASIEMYRGSSPFSAAASSLTAKDDI